MMQDPFRKACSDQKMLEKTAQFGREMVEEGGFSGRLIGFALHSETLEPLAILEAESTELFAGPIGVLVPAPVRDGATAVILSRETPSAWRHRKGGLYTRLGSVLSNEGSMVLYASNVDNRPWLRMANQFEDGRFSPAPGAQMLDFSEVFPHRSEGLHNPGGKVRIALRADTTGNATFSRCGRYRHTLTRDWTAQGEVPRSILWIGMNPSVADAQASDPTCNREQIFSADWGFTRYIKTNILDWRATSPKDLPRDPSLARSAQNLACILDQVRACEMIVLGYGKMHTRFQPAVRDTLAALRQNNHRLFCLALNSDGSARHPLYLKKTLTPIPFPE